MSSNFSIMRFCGNHMIFQSGRKNTIFGHAPISEKVTLKITGITEKTLFSSADENGRWEIEIPAYPSSFNAFALEFSCGGQIITFEDVLFGELYHISGQSNMELPLNSTIDPLNEDIPKGNIFIREFRVPVKCCFGKDEEYDDFLGGEWKTAVGDDLMEISAAGYYFAAELYRKYNVPVGLVNTSAGGSPVEARMPYSILSELGGYEEFLNRCTVPGYEENTAEADCLKYSQWSSKLDSEDKISDNIFEADSGFTKCSVPFYFRDEPALNGFCGRIWFKKTFEIPANAPLDNAVLILGAMIDADKVYINGKEAGSTDYMYPPRIYPLPQDILHSGENTVHICLEVRQGQGGFVKGKKYCLKLSDRIID
ncbi:MAG: sialate O-acetylesterase, partial [Huintestinicola sp.]